MSAGARRLSVALILVATLAGPVAEMFDRWDHTVQDGNDTEANIVIVALCVGVAIVAAVGATLTLAPPSSLQRFASINVQHPLAARMRTPLTTDIRPPTILRV